jgi:hypothetical protein
MSEKICAKCGSAGPFQVVPNGERCQACGDVQAHPAPVKYEQVPDPPGPVPDVSRINWRNPLGM